jgi:hypothetical protein
MSFPSVHMVGVSFGISSSIGSVSGAFQTLTHNQKAEIEQVRNGDGATVTKVFYDPSEEATFEYVAIGSNGSKDAVVTSGSVGSFVTVTDAQYAGIAGTTWLVDDVTINGSNTTSKRVTLKLTRYPAITS